MLWRWGRGERKFKFTCKFTSCQTLHSKAAVHCVNVLQKPDRLGVPGFAPTPPPQHGNAQLCIPPQKKRSGVDWLSLLDDWPDSSEKRQRLVFWSYCARGRGDRGRADLFVFPTSSRHRHCSLRPMHINLIYLNKLFKFKFMVNLPIFRACCWTSSGRHCKLRGWIARQGWCIDFRPNLACCTCASESLVHLRI